MPHCSCGCPTPPRERGLHQVSRGRILDIKGKETLLWTLVHSKQSLALSGGGGGRGEMNRPNLKRPGAYLMREEDLGLACPAGGPMALLRHRVALRLEPSATCFPQKHPA